MEKGSSPETESASSTIKVNALFNGRSIPLDISVDSTIKDLKGILQNLTDVLPRGQKLIFKGKILVDEVTLRSAGVSNGSKIMLMATKGLHQGDDPFKKDTRMATRRMPEMVKERKEQVVVRSKLDRWKATGIIALSECCLKVIPEEVWDVGSSTRVLDLRHNLLQDCPARIGQLTSIQKLLLDINEISDESISWEGLASLKSLAVLSLNQNLLQMLPSALGALTCLKNLEVGNNQLTCLPTEIGLLTKLEVLKANNNRLHIVPPSIGGCISLLEVDLSSNLLVELPETFVKLKDLKVLNLSNNGLRSLPGNLFKMCAQLSTLDLHGTEITMDILRGVEGWEDFDTRRRLKHQKQLDFRVASSAEFDEGADKR